MEILEAYATEEITLAREYDFSQPHISALVVEAGALLTIIVTDDDRLVAVLSGGKREAGTAYRYTAEVTMGQIEPA